METWILTMRPHRCLAMTHKIYYYANLLAALPSHRTIYILRTARQKLTGLSLRSSRFPILRVNRNHVSRPSTQQHILSHRFSCFALNIFPASIHQVHLLSPEPLIFRRKLNTIHRMRSSRNWLSIGSEMRLGTSQEILQKSPCVIIHGEHVMDYPMRVAKVVQLMMRRTVWLACNQRPQLIHWAYHA